MQSIDFDIKKTNLYEEVANSLENMIVHSADQLGEKLPSEQSLANSFGVSRNVIRESLKLLKERGLVMVRAGGGAYISRPESDMLTSMIGRFVAMDGTDDLDVYDMRILLETESCRLATLRATPKDLDELDEITRQIQARYDDHNQRTQLDIQFHTRIAEMSGNRLLTLFVHSMASLILLLIRQAIKSPLNSDTVLPYHKRILEAMRARDAEKASLIMREHLLESKRRYCSVQSAGKEETSHDL